MKGLGSLGAGQAPSAAGVFAWGGEQSFLKMLGAGVGWVSPGEYLPTEREPWVWGVRGPSPWGTGLWLLHLPSTGLLRELSRHTPL